MIVNEKSINEKFGRFMKTSRGKQISKNFIATKMRSSDGTLANGGRVMTDADRDLAVNAFINILLTECDVNDIPTSLRKNIRTSCWDKLILPGGVYQYKIYFGDRSGMSLRRESLEWPEDENSPYDGIDNIIALFNNGYEASNYAYGYWKSNDTYMGPYYFGVTRSKKNRPYLGFIHTAVEKFNSTYGLEHNVIAVASDEYE